MASVASKDYFCFPGIIAFLLVPLGMLHVSMATLCPVISRQLPLGPIGNITTYLMYQHPFVIPCIFWLSWAAHLVEAVYAFFVAWRLDFSKWCCIKWSIQTFLYGYFSMKLLFSFESRRKNW